MQCAINLAFYQKSAVNFEKQKIILVTICIVIHNEIECLPTQIGGKKTTYYISLNSNKNF